LYPLRCRREKPVRYNYRTRSGEIDDHPSVLFRENEVWITLRISSGAAVLQGEIGTGLVRVPIVERLDLKPLADLAADHGSRS
jgi:hypothetical protein